MQASRQYDGYVLDKTEQEDKNPLLRLKTFAKALQQRLRGKGFALSSLNEDSEGSFGTDSDSDEEDSVDDLRMSDRSVLNSIRTYRRGATQVSGHVSEDKKLLKESGLKEYEALYGLTKA